MTRFGVLGDVHGEDAIVCAALELFARERVERVLCVGDVVDGPGDPARTLAALAAADCVRGNHDRWYLAGELRDLPDALPVGTLSAEHRRWLAGLPATRVYDTPHGKLLLCHGLGDDDMASLGPDESGYALENNDAVTRLLVRSEHRFVLSGHSHRRMVRRLGEVTFINAGTLLRVQQPCVLVLDLSELTACFHDWVEGAFVPVSPMPLP